MAPRDEELLERIALRESSALSILYDRYSRLLYGMSLSILHDTDNAEDVLQEVFVQVWRKASSYQASLGSVKNWLIRIAHNRAVNVLRSKLNRERQSEISIPDDGEIAGQEFTSAFVDESPWVLASRSEEQASIAGALGYLPDEQRVLVELAFFQGFSHSEIAEHLGIPLGTVKTRIRAGLRVLRENLKFLRDEAI